MKMNHFIALILTISALGFSSPSYAGGYIGGGLGLSSFDYDDIDDGNAYKVFAGYKFADSSIALEASYIDMGEADVEGVPLELLIDGLNASLVFNPTAPNQPVSFLGRIGMYSFDTELKGPGGSITDDSTGLSWGLGIDFAASEHFSFRGEIEGFLGVEDFADDEMVTLISVGLQYNF